MSFHSFQQYLVRLLDSCYLLHVMVLPNWYSIKFINVLRCTGLLKLIYDSHVPTVCYDGAESLLFVRKICILVSFRRYICAYLNLLMFLVFPV